MNISNSQLIYAFSDILKGQPIHPDALPGSTLASKDGFVVQHSSCKQDRSFVPQDTFADSLGNCTLVIDSNIKAGKPNFIHRSFPKLRIKLSFFITPINSTSENLQRLTNTLSFNCSTRYGGCSLLNIQGAWMSDATGEKASYSGYEKNEGIQLVLTVLPGQKKTTLHAIDQMIEKWIHFEHYLKQACSIQWIHTDVSYTIAHHHEI